MDRLDPDDDGWAHPPAGVARPDGTNEPVWVDARLNLRKVSNVDTVNGTAFVRIEIVLYWTDPRLASWPKGTALPEKLWGPRLSIANPGDGGEIAESRWAFELESVDDLSARMKCGRTYAVVIDNPMDLQGVLACTACLYYFHRLTAGPGGHCLSCRLPLRHRANRGAAPDIQLVRAE